MGLCASEPRIYALGLTADAYFAERIVVESKHLLESLGSMCLSQHSQATGSRVSVELEDALLIFREFATVDAK